MNNLEKGPEPSQEQIEYNEQRAWQLVEEGKIATLSHELGSGQYPEEALDKRLAMALLDKNNPDAIYCVAWHLKNFNGLDEEVIDRLISLSGKGAARDYVNSIANNLERFRVSDYGRLAKTLIQNGESWNVLANWEKFANADLLEAAKEIIAHGDPQAIVHPNNWDKFAAIKKEVYSLLPEGQKIHVESKM